MTRFLILSLIWLFAAGSLASCGLRGNPSPPAGKVISWPGSYPSQ
ncbi:MAG: hypothetical protein ORO03_07430 [Alphaproteobacteria bacterium]|nr:hypothetical protein [Alphaproteobacteria bacterium]